MLIVYRSVNVEAQKKKVDLLVPEPKSASLENSCAPAPSLCENVEEH